MKNKFIYLAIIAAGFASCEPEFENTVDANYTAGDADFTTYVAVGNSLTAGYMDGTVSRVGQTYSFPNLLAQQFALVGGGAFTQPSYAEDVNNLGGIQGLTGTRLVINASVGGVQPIAGTPTITLTPQATAYNNMGVPGAKSFHLTFPGYGALNPYFTRHATSPTATVLGDAMSKVPTFFTNWIGANDVLAYATSGGAQADGVTPAADHNSTGNMNPATYGMNDITNSNVFASVYSTIVTTLTSGGAKGVVATVPSVTSIPYFTTVKYNAISDAAIASNPQASLLVQLYGFLSVATNGRITPLNLTDGVNNALLINDSDLTSLSAQITAYANASGNPLLVSNANALGAIYGKSRLATAEDLVVLTASGILLPPNNVNASLPAPFNLNGITAPLANKWVLTANEKAKVANATAAYNAAIVSIANANDIAVADMNAIMNQLVSGLRIETGQLYTANYFSGSATEGVVLFSLDGVHPNARGYAVIANEVIKVINEFYNANLPLHNPSYFPGINIVSSN
ncbi:MAG: G-D-S-L family lipolytic protein [Flavobacterium sp.]|uniref:G-D-S-L family lipolytic protein n=1 Tax=Flavobacterium sp. TaxID=239 RepID=UPI001B55CD52|nr:G-D-S-L family lipolytic protein [Flavobacterium sp.]MBP9848475.1 G-D-S-L family lipolytic protein [Flavobacterium sp.]WRH74465.1 MAG: G-D-S-L family lipolytic protein [Flavobacterium sp.]